jgi:hypothetical protein
MSGEAKPLEDLPEALGRITSRFGGTKPFTLDLLVTGCGHPREAEIALLSILEHRHAQQPFDWLFVDQDGTRDATSDAIVDDIDVKAYRAFPNLAITRGIIGMFVKSMWASAAWGFAVVSQPPVPQRREEEWL